VIVPDVNLLVYAYNVDAPLHAEARRWWESLLQEGQLIGVPWAVSCGFIRLMTHPRVLETPMEPGAAVSSVRAWFAEPTVRPLHPGPLHLEILENFVNEAGVGGNLVTDAHIAALAVEHQAELHSNDTDFSRFSGLNWINPLD